MSTNITFGTNTATLNQDSIGGFSISGNDRMIIVENNGLSLSTYVGGAWTQPAIPFSPPTPHGYGAQPCITVDGSRVIAAPFRSVVSFYSWNPSTSIYDTPVVIPQNVAQRDWVGLACTPDGSTLVAFERYGYAYFTKWNASVGNYNQWTQILMPSSMGSLGFSGGSIAIMGDASKIVYGGGAAEGGPIYYSLWDNVAQNFGPPQVLSAEVKNYADFSITQNGHVLIIGGGDLLDTGSPVDSGDCKYSVFNPQTNTFGPLVRTGNFIYAGQTWLSSDDTILYYISFNGISQVPIIIQTSPPLYLGDDLIITGSNVEFNNASVSVKAPTIGVHVTNKTYVDGIVQAESASREAERAAMQALIDTLEAQMDAVYQYFFNQARNGPPPTRN